jgi:hypothetical protein
MSKSIKEIYTRNLNRIGRLNEKISEFENKKDVCKTRIEKLILLWIKHNHKEWLDDILIIGGKPWMETTPQKDKIDVKFIKIDFEDDENGHYVNHTIKINELV